MDIINEKLDSISTRNKVVGELNEEFAILSENDVENDSTIIKMFDHSSVTESGFDSLSEEIEAEVSEAAKGISFTKVKDIKKKSKEEKYDFVDPDEITSMKDILTEE